MHDAASRSLRAESQEVEGLPPMPSQLTAPKGAYALTSTESSKAKTSEAPGKPGDYPKWTEEGSAPSCPVVTWLTRRDQN
ncbi:hypothetical protein E5288_WYG010962 [Bos mutus]|uniref:Uncharacterized protein n=1 Tax=Bos mutus TaxID=72004 RepID=A0A6B0QWH5_9CETA|nr:hypothetical protein [Bos mutus]